jgi:hypothetical protein
MIQVVGKSRRIILPQVNESISGTRVWNLSVSRKQRKDVWSKVLIDNAAGSIKVCAKRIVIPVLACILFVIVLQWRVNKCNHVWQWLGKINDGSSTSKFLDRHNTNIRVDTASNIHGRGKNGSRRRKRLTSRFVKRVGSLNRFVARAGNETDSIRGSSIVWLESTVLDSSRNRSK